MSKKHILSGTLIAALAFVIWFAVAPPRWWLNLTKTVDLTDPAATGKTLVEKYGCRRCHQIHGSGKFTAPNLAGVTQRLDAISLRLWLQNPRAIKWRTVMPKYNLSDSEIEAIIAYLSSPKPS